jgi:hypothetical protein
VNAHGLTVVPRRGSAPFLGERCEPDLLHVDETRTLGRGGCSVVHLGRLTNERLERQCAVKVFNTMDKEQQKQLEQVCHNKYNLNRFVTICCIDNTCILVQQWVASTIQLATSSHQFGL